jgi:hypothetical protein
MNDPKTSNAISAEQSNQKIDSTIRVKKYPPVVAAQLVIKHFLEELCANNAPGNLHWNGDDNQTEIYIGIWTGRPAIHVKPMLMISRSTVGSPDLWPKGVTKTFPKFNAEMVTQIQSIPIAINCVSKEPIEAETLGANVFQSMYMFQDKLMTMGLKSIRNMGLGPIRVAEGFYSGTKSEAYAAQVSCNILIEMTWVKSLMDEKGVLEFVKQHGIDPSNINTPPQQLDDVTLYRI